MGRNRPAPPPLTQGALVLVPFPFTDLSGTRRRPALVVSPDGFHPEDLVLCAVTSQVPPVLGAWEVPLQRADLLGAALPKPSVIRVGKLFTMHRDLVVARFGRIAPAKRNEVLARLRQLFGRPS